MKMYEVIIKKPLEEPIRSKIFAENSKDAIDRIVDEMLHGNVSRGYVQLKEVKDVERAWNNYEVARDEGRV